MLRDICAWTSREFPRPGHRRALVPVEIGNRTDAYDLMERWRSQRFNPRAHLQLAALRHLTSNGRPVRRRPPSPSRWCDQLLDEENFRLAYQNLVSSNGRFLMINDPLDKPMAALAPYADWALRLVCCKLPVLWIQQATDWGFASMMLDGNQFLAVLVAFAEIAAGLGIILGAFTSSLITRLAGLAIIPVMIGAILMVHGQNGFRFMARPDDPTGTGGWNFQLVLIGIGLFYFIRGNVDQQSAVEA